MRENAAHSELETRDPRETSDTYYREVFRQGRYRVAVCRDGLQWLFQRKRLECAAGGAAWDTLGYCVTRSALMRLHQAHIGGDAPDIATLPLHIRAGGAP